MRVSSNTLTRVAALWLGAIALALPANCQYMNDGSSVYVDTWDDGTYMHGVGATQGQLSIHRYDVDSSLTSPNGRTVSSSSGYMSGCVQAQVSLLLDYTEVGDWVTTTGHKGYCTAAHVYFVLAQLRKTRPTPTQYCADGTTVSYCAEGNQVAPLGAMKSTPSCNYFDSCCQAGGQAAPGWCRRETCQKCTGQQMDAKPSQCTNEQACHLITRIMCLASCQQ